MATALQPRGGHIQLFAAIGVGQVQWRLLSGNNREIGRGAQVFADAESCRIAVKELQARFHETETFVRRAGGHSWTWQVSLAGKPVAAAAHNYDRLIRCERGLAQFVAQVAVAGVGPVLMLSQARRWRTSVG
ncbi:MAG: hypothetical protein QOK11_681 [Pseudonocardiales bacterium]|jgi:hypothetical protein|nr:hypothetical protein [Pseudonocardiales bacterium]MDT4946903.1 hypothetical protein [Pseudonocardiales bacterium]